MNKTIHFLIICFALFSCAKKEISTPVSENTDREIIAAADISAYPEILKTNPSFFDANGMQEDFLSILKKNGVNTIRLKLWVNPTEEHAGFEEVRQFSKTLKGLGFKIWLTLHYSDTWADPSQQLVPADWQGIAMEDLRDSVYNYTEKIVTTIDPHYIQIGNEINTGLLHPYGHITDNHENFIALLASGINAVRKNSSGKIILHFAGLDNSEWFFDQVHSLDYDIIGLSYYPIWHGKAIANLKTKIEALSQSHNKDILIAETAYPFTLEWNDWTNNILGLEEQLILPDYPATKEGQRKFLHQIKQVITDSEKGLGFCYWGAELIAWKGHQATDASPWENQALFDFNNQALPVLSEFKIE